LISRLLNPSKLHSYFIFGARGTGKSTLLQKLFELNKGPDPDVLYFDLLDPKIEKDLALHPENPQAFGCGP